MRTAFISSKFYPECTSQFMAVTWCDEPPKSLRTFPWGRHKTIMSRSRKTTWNHRHHRPQHGPGMGGPGVSPPCQREQHLDWRPRGPPSQRLEVASQINWSHGWWSSQIDIFEIIIYNHNDHLRLININHPSLMIILYLIWHNLSSTAGSCARLVPRV